MKQKKLILLFCACAALLSGALFAFTAVDSTVNVTATSSIVLPANPNRITVEIVNGGSTDVYIHQGDTATAPRGILLKANGGAFEINQVNLYQGDISAVTASGTTTLSIEEGSR